MVKPLQQRIRNKGIPLEKLGKLDNGKIPTDMKDVLHCPYFLTGKSCRTLVVFVSSDSNEEVLLTNNGKLVNTAHANKTFLFNATNSYVQELLRSYVTLDRVFVITNSSVRKGLYSISFIDKCKLYFISHIPLVSEDLQSHDKLNLLAEHIEELDKWRNTGISQKVLTSINSYPTLSTIKQEWVLDEIFKYLKQKNPT